MFADNLRKQMVERGITQGELSRITGIGRSSISQYLSGKNEPSDNRKIVIADAVGCSVEDLEDDEAYPIDPEFKIERLDVKEAARIPEYAKESGLSEIVIRRRINDLLKLGQITEEDCVVPGTKRIFISGKMKRLFQTYNEIVVSNRTVKTPNVKRKPGQYRPIDQTKCRTCQYYSPHSLTCDYILITRHSRGCNWGDDCDKYQRGKKKREQVDLHLGRNK